MQYNKKKAKMAESGRRGAAKSAQVNSKAESACRTIVKKIRKGGIKYMTKKDMAQKFHVGYYVVDMVYKTLGWKTLTPTQRGEDGYETKNKNLTVKTLHPEGTKNWLTRTWA